MTRKSVAKPLVLFGTLGFLLGLTAAGSALAVSMARVNETLAESGIGKPDPFSDALSGGLPWVTLGGTVALFSGLAILVGIVWAFVEKGID